MSQKIKVLVAAMLLSASTFVMAADIAEDMDTIATNYGAVLKTDSIDRFKEGLQGMRVAALDAQKGIPSKLSSKGPDSAEVKDFRHGLTILIDQIDQSLALANQGKLEEARKVAQEFKATRDVYHKKYR
ncbi:cytochrome b562 [Yersinia ruckeri]|uniref:cytochrome b562 n=1 Tax=Yersinia ruckeri TaxID=29486 RepID=UPI0008FE6BE3|nr:cytochrome b562 [Yersinia ruckeri]EKN4688721.1 cytochrome b562 [Yersinia ruckeri]MCK8585845.1 cytochrome b562 [Yersinia ruckeri]MCW6555584.1 cytochrome b562 [Yersinia ruckeri]MCW6635820.1 cytochrome b562 [Yersinia ruckeri]OJC01720.1 cytochrome B562 [Yersinia ruckeri]